MCNCIQETEQRYKEHLKKNDPVFKDMGDFEVGFVNKAWLFDRKGTALALPIEVEWKHIAKSGKASTKRKTSNFIVEYCPFCGEKQSKEDKQYE